MKRTISIIVFGLLVILAACGKDAETTTPSTQAASPSVNMGEEGSDSADFERKSVRGCTPYRWNRNGQTTVWKCPNGKCTGPGNGAFWTCAQ